MTNFVNCREMAPCTIGLMCDRTKGDSKTKTDSTYSLKILDSLPIIYQKLVGASANGGT